MISAQSLQDEIVKALGLIGIGQNEKAVVIYDSLINEYPTAPTLYLLKGEALSNVNGQYTVDTVQYDKAVACFKKAIEIDNKFFDAYRSMGLLNIYHQRFKKATIDFSYCIRYAENDLDKFKSYSDRGAAFQHLMQYEQAEFDYYEALRLRPQSPGVYTNLALIHMDKGDYEFALQLCEKGLEFKPDDNTLLNNIGFIRLHQEKYTDAITTFSKLLRKTPNDPIALSNRGFARLKLKQYEAAQKDLDKSIAAYPTNSYAFKNRALLYLATSQNEKACADLREAQRLGFTQMHGEEVESLILVNCGN